MSGGQDSRGPDAEEPRWDERMRRNPVVVAVAVAIALMAGMAVLREFFTSTLPWLLSFVEPVQSAMEPITSWLAAHAGEVSVALASLAAGLAAGVAYGVMSARHKARHAEVERMRSTLEGMMRVYEEALASGSPTAAEQSELRNDYMRLAEALERLN